MEERLTKTLEAIRSKGNYRTIKYLKPLSATRVQFDSREYLNLCSNSYLSLHLHPDIIEASREALDTYGAGTCSSRSVAGSIDLYRDLEDEAADYKGYPAGLVFSNGYMANIGVISTIVDRGDVIFTDELNHASLIDSMRLSGAKRIIFRHRDTSDLEKKLANTRTRGTKFIITESIFSMDGDIAPLDKICHLKEQYGAKLILDDAHGTGVFGETGTGVEEYFCLQGKADIHMATFGKALGSFGAFVLSSELVIDYLVNRARTFMYTTALSPAVLAASLAALRLLKGNGAYKDELWENIRYLRSGLESHGFDLKESNGPIIPIVVGEDAKTVRMQESLMERGLFLQAIRPPTVPEGTSRLRLTVIRGFSRDDIDYALNILVDTGKKMGLI